MIMESESFAKPLELHCCAILKGGEFKVSLRRLDTRSLSVRMGLLFLVADFLANVSDLIRGRKMSSSWDSFFEFRLESSRLMLKELAPPLVGVRNKFASV